MLGQYLSVMQTQWKVYFYIVHGSREIGSGNDKSCKTSNFGNKGDNFMFTAPFPRFLAITSSILMLSSEASVCHSNCPQPQLRQWGRLCFSVSCSYAAADPKQTPSRLKPPRRSRVRAGAAKHAGHWGLTAIITRSHSLILNLTEEDNVFSLRQI